MSWFRRFIRQHLMADDPTPEYSRLDHHDGLQEKPPNTQEPGSLLPARNPANTQNATLAAIQERIMANEDEYTGGLVDQSVRDRLYLLALVRDQAAALAAVNALADYLETLTEGDRHYAALIREALTATEGA